MDDIQPLPSSKKLGSLRRYLKGKRYQKIFINIFLFISIILYRYYV